MSKMKRDRDRGAIAMLFGRHEAKKIASCASPLVQIEVQAEVSRPIIFLNTANCLFMIPYGLGAAISTRVSNELGVGRPQAARLAMRVVVFLAISEGLAMGVALVCVRYVWGHAYSDGEEVVTYVARMLLVISVANFLDGIQCVARGCGWQNIGACINLGAFYVVGVPAAYLIAFVLCVGGMGLWMGIVCGILVQVLLLLTITLCTDWQKEAKNRVSSSSIPTETS